MKLKMRPLHRMTYIALLAALAMMCMLLFGIKLIPGASYLKYDPSGGVILLCGLLLGPAVDGPDAGKAQGAGHLIQPVHPLVQGVQQGDLQRGDQNLQG